MAKERKPQLPARGLGWTDEAWDEYVRKGHKKDPDPPKVRLTATTTEGVKS